MTNTRTLQASAAIARETRTGSVAIPVKQLPYLRFLSAVLNKPLNQVAAKFLRKRR